MNDVRGGFARVAQMLEITQKSALAIIQEP
jgi:hypothetical protein